MQYNDNFCGFSLSNFSIPKTISIVTGQYRKVERLLQVSVITGTYIHIRKTSKHE